MLVIIGGTSGIGLETARYLQTQNYDVTIAGRHDPKEKQLKYSYIDVADEKSVQHFFSQINSMDTLIYSAGITAGKKSIASFDKDLFNKMMSINVTGLLLCIKHAYTLLKKAKGKIAVVNSLAARTYSQFSGIEYTISKTALSGLVKQLAIELAEDDIMINSIFPSMTATPMLVKNVDKNVLDAVEKNIPLKRILQPIEVAKAIEFLVSDNNSYMTGSGIDINGGLFLNA